MFKWSVLLLRQERTKEKEKAYLIMNTIPLDQTSIRPDGRKRVPWLGRRIGKLLRKRSSSNRVKKRPSLFRRMKSGTKSMDTGSYSSSSGTPSPRRSESMKDRLQRSLKKGTSSSTKRKQASTCFSSCTEHFTYCANHHDHTDLQSQVTVRSKAQHSGYITYTMGNTSILPGSDVIIATP